MKNKAAFISILFIFLMTTSVSSLVAVEYLSQDNEEVELAPKYKKFLTVLQYFLNSEEKREAFLKLKTDHDRDIYIDSFYNLRGRQQRGVRANINTLRLVRMVQFLDLREEQIAAIMPVMSKNEKEKQSLQRDLQLQMRNLRILLRKDNPHEQTLSVLLGHIKSLKERLQSKEVEFEEFLADNLSLIQQAKYIIFSQEFYQGLQQQLNDARRVQQGLQRQKRIKR